MRGCFIFAIISCIVFISEMPVKAQDVKKTVWDGITVFSFTHARLYLDERGLQDHDRLVINGPLFHADGKPVGGYITPIIDERGRKETRIQMQPLTDPASGGGNFALKNYIFGKIKGGGFFMQPYSPRMRIEDFQTEFAIQNGVALLVEGKNLHPKISSHRKTRIGIGYNSKTQHFYIVDSQLPITFHGLAERLRKAGADNAIYLDGNATGYEDKEGKTGALPNNAVKIHVY